jgi:hypothetical protein
MLTCGERWEAPSRSCRRYDARPELAREPRYPRCLTPAEFGASAASRPNFEASSSSNVERARRQAENENLLRDGGADVDSTCAANAAGTPALSASP